MKRTLLTLSLTLVGALLFAATAQATSCGGVEFTLVAQNNIGFEQGPTTINGNVLVTSATGTANVGAHNRINGKLFAANIFVGTNAFVEECHGAVSGPGTCGATFPFDPPAACTATFPPPPLVVPAADVCANTAPNVTVTNGTITVGGVPQAPPLAPGCYGSLRLNANAVLELQTTSPYRFKDIRMLTGSTLESDTVLTKATVNVNGLTVSEPGVFITDIHLNSAAKIGAGVALGNAATLLRTVINAPFTNIHPRTGTALQECSELIGKTLTIEPINTDCVPPDLICVCPPGSHFETQVCAPGLSCEDARRCVPN